MVTIAYYTFVKLIECTPRVNSVVNDRFCMIMICQGGFIDCNNVPLWCGILIARRLCLCEVKGVGIWELSVLSAEYWCETKTLGNKAYLKKFNMTRNRL